MHHNKFAAGPASPDSKKRSKKEMSQFGEDFERMSIGTQKRRKLPASPPSERGHVFEPFGRSKQAKLTKQQESAKENLAFGPEEKQESPQGKSCLDDRKQVESQRKPDGIYK